jgi:hypothetical protein
MSQEVKDRIDIESERPTQPVNTQNPSLLLEKRIQEFRTRWETIQTGFVDEPRQSVENADALIAEVMQDITQTFSEERQKLEAQWGRGDNVSTEDLRVALQRYRAFFSRLLSI